MVIREIEKNREIKGRPGRKKEDVRQSPMLCIHRSPMFGMPRSPMFLML